MPTKASPSGRAPSVAWRRSTKRWTNTKPLPTEDTLVVGSHLHRITGLDPATGEEKWQADTGKYISQTLAVGDTVLVRSQTSRSSWSSQDSSEVLAHHSENGRLLWNSSLDSGPWISPLGGLFLSDAEGSFGRRDADTGETRWTHPLRLSRPPHFCRDGDLLVSAQTEDYRTLLQRLDGQTGEVEWTLEAGDWIERLQVGQDYALVGSAKQALEETQLSLIDLQTGRRIRDFEARDMLEARFHNGVLYAATREEPGCRYTALDPSSGATLWSRQDLPLGAFVKDNFKLTDRSLLLASYKNENGKTRGHALRALNTADGRDRWSFETPAAQFLSIMDCQDGVVLAKGSKVEGFGEILFAVDEESGQQLWTFDPQSSVHAVYPGPDGKLLLQTEEDGYRLHLLEGRTGQSLWQFNTGEKLEPQITDEGLLVADHEGNVFKLDWEAGEPFRGGPPRDPGKSRGSSSFYAGDDVICAEKDGHHAVWIDRNGDSKADPGRDYLLIQDRDGDGRITRPELANLPSWSEIAALDTDGDGLVDETEWQERGLCLWRDGSKDGLMSAREIEPVGTSSGHYAVFDLERGRIEYSGRERFQNGHLPELRPPTFEQQLPIPDILPPDYEQELRGHLRRVLPSLAGDRRSSSDGSRWLANRHPEGLDVYTELQAWGGARRQQLEFRVNDDSATLQVKQVDSGTSQTLQLSAADSSAEKFFFAYPDSWQGDQLRRGGGLVVEPNERGLTLLQLSPDTYQKRPDGGLDRTGSGGRVGYTFDEVKETRIPGAEPIRDIGEINFEEDFIDINGVLVPVG